MRTPAVLVFLGYFAHIGHCQMSSLAGLMGGMSGMGGMAGMGGMGAMLPEGMSMQDMMMMQMMSGAGGSGGGAGGSGGSGGIDPAMLMMLAQGGGAGGGGAAGMNELLPMLMMMGNNNDPPASPAAPPARGGATRPGAARPGTARAGAQPPNQPSASAPAGSSQNEQGGMASSIANLLGMSGNPISPAQQTQLWGAVTMSGGMQRIMDAVQQPADRVQLERDGLPGMRPMMQMVMCPRPTTCPLAFCESTEIPFTPESFYVCRGCPRCRMDASQRAMMSMMSQMGGGAAGMSMPMGK